jgi:YfiH family protein
VIRAAPLSELTGIRHGFFSRQGGVSDGLYASLNCGYGSKDSPVSVAENRSRAMAQLALPAEALCTAYQCHGTDVLTVDETWHPNDSPQADGMVTNRAGIALGILTADCAPVLFADDTAGVIGAAHAGWKGALTGILDATLGAMHGLGAHDDNIRASIGPCIGSASYEVSNAFRDQFEATDPENGDFFRPAERSGHYFFDLAGYVARRLQHRGIKGVDVVGRDTHQEETLFFSYRRACQRDEPDYGRCLSAIVLA